MTAKTVGKKIIERKEGKRKAAVYSSQVVL